MKKARVEHKKHFGNGVYELYDEEERFRRLKEQIPLLRKNISENDLLILEDNNWIQSDRPDWINETLNACIEDSTVEDANHFIDRHFARRGKKMKEEFSSLDKASQTKILKEQANEEAEGYNDKFDPFVIHFPSGDTIKEANNNRSIENWKKSIKHALDKHKKMLEEDLHEYKAIFLYDVTPPYAIEYRVMSEGSIMYNPMNDKSFIDLFRNYPAKIIWFMNTQKKIVIFDSKDLEGVVGEEVNYQLVHPFDVIF